MAALTLGTAAAGILEGLGAALGAAGLGAALGGNLGIKNELNNAKNEALINAGNEEIGEAAISSGIGIKNNWLTNPKEPFTGWENENENENEEKNPIPPIIENTGGEGIQDTTNESVGENTNTPSMNWQEWATQMRNEQWEREDQIRAETQEREDTAYQRSVEDMRKAGINPNLVGVSPAQSGGGITNATGVDTSTITNDMTNTIEMLQQMIDNNFKGDENDKDRLIEGIASLMQMAGMFAIAFGKKK